MLFLKFNLHWVFPAIFSVSFNVAADKLFMETEAIFISQKRSKSNKGAVHFDMLMF